MRHRYDRHGHSKVGMTTPTYYSWAKMIQRCSNPNDPKYPRYGGRGIAFCDRWTNFPNFLADLGEKPKGMTLERVNVNGNYEPGNCKWASPKEQANNKTSNRIIEWRGKSMTSSQWADSLGITFSALRQRLYRGWSIERVFTQTVRKKVNV